MARRYQNIVAWKRTHALTIEVYQHTRGFPSEERYGLTSQLRRAAMSVPTNVVEGSARESNNEYLQFLFIARASLKETEYLLLLAHDLGYLADDAYANLADQQHRAAGTLAGLIKSVRKDAG